MILPRRRSEEPRPRDVERWRHIHSYNDEEVPLAEITGVETVVNGLTRFLNRKSVRYYLSYNEGDAKARIEIKGKLSYPELERYLRSLDGTHDTDGYFRKIVNSGSEIGYGIEKWEKEIDYLSEKVKITVKYEYKNGSTRVTSILVTAGHYNHYDENL